jgi:hypothetical protein
MAELPLQVKGHFLFGAPASTFKRLGADKFIQFF